eukprot:scaffold41757_cov47-Cyclotella_meneghiniana.AAC.2
MPSALPPNRHRLWDDVRLVNVGHGITIHRLSSQPQPMDNKNDVVDEAHRPRRWMGRTTMPTTNSRQHAIPHYEEELVHTVLHDVGLVSNIMFILNVRVSSAATNVSTTTPKAQGECLTVMHYYSSMRQAGFGLIHSTIHGGMELSILANFHDSGPFRVLLVLQYTAGNMLIGSLALAPIRHTAKLYSYVSMTGQSRVAMLSPFHKILRASFKV